MSTKREYKRQVRYDIHILATVGSNFQEVLLNNMINGEIKALEIYLNSSHKHNDILCNIRRFPSNTEYLNTFDFTFSDRIK